MTISKLKIAATAAAALLVVGGTTTFVLQRHAVQSAAMTSATADAADDEALGIIDTGDSRALAEAPPLVFLRVHRGPPQPAWRISSNGKVMGRSVSFQELLTMAYATSEGRLKILDSQAWQDQRFDYLVSLSSAQMEALQQAIREKLGITVRPERRSEDVYVLSVRAGDFPGLQPAAQPRGGTSINNTGGRMIFENITVNSLVRTLEQLTERPVINETGLRNHYDVSLTWGEPDEKQPGPEALKKALAEQLGLDLTAGKRELEILLVRATRTP